MNTVIFILFFHISSSYSIHVGIDQFPVINSAFISVSKLPQSQAFKLTYSWNAVRTSSDLSVFVNIVDDSGKTVLKDDHSLPNSMKTSTWSGKINYTHLIRIPDTLKNGNYKIYAGLYDRASKTRQELKAGRGVGTGQNLSYLIGSFTVDSNAPVPPLDSSGPKTLDLDGYKIAFQDEFDQPLDVSAWGPGTKWIAHTPYAGDFGDAKFTDPSGDFPFSVADGILTISARKVGDKWQSGLLCSVDKQGNGFAQQYGYFEIRSKFPKGPGTWPAFWLLALRKLVNKADMGFEVDIVEQYGREPNILHGVLHWWPPEKNLHKSAGKNFLVEEMYKDYHTYGFMWDEKEMMWYFDGVELWRQPTPEESKTPLYVLFNLALGPGWPIDKTPDPSDMLIDYVRVYQKVK